MGELETISRKRQRNNDLQKIILSTVAVAGLMSIAIMAPNVLQALGKLGLAKLKRQKEIITITRKRLVNAGLLKYEGKFLQLTTKGEAKLRQLELHDYKFKKPKRWDKKWRMLIFDIKNNRGSLRDKVRHTLMAIGFRRLQNSVWVYPYPCDDLITLLKADFKIGSELLYVIVETIENDKKIRQNFGLAK